MKKQESQGKKFRQLSDEELEKVNGGITTCWTDDMDYCQKKLKGVWNKENCTCNGKYI